MFERTRCDILADTFDETNVVLQFCIASDSRREAVRARAFAGPNIDDDA